MYYKNRHRLYCIIFTCLSIVFSVEWLGAQESTARPDEAWQARALDCERRIYQGLPLMEEALVLMEKAECYRQMNALDLAAKTLDRIALYALNDSLRSEVFALRAACQLDIIPEHSSSTQPKTLKNPDTARWLSLIPGVGHFYAGAVGEGIFSMVLNSAAIAFIAMEWSSGLYVGAFLGGGILLSQPYLGGTERAIQLVHEYNIHQMAPQRINHPF